MTCVIRCLSVSCMFYMCSGDRPLHIAVRQARTDAAILLLSHGADTSAINNLHETAAEVGV